MLLLILLVGGMMLLMMMLVVRWLMRRRGKITQYFYQLGLYHLLWGGCLDELNRVVFRLHSWCLLVGHFYIAALSM
jgi:hypothetical protein